MASTAQAAALQIIQDQLKSNHKYARNALLVSIVSVLVAVAAATPVVLNLFGILSPSELQQRESASLGFVKGLTRTDPYVGVRRALAFTEPGSLVDRAANIKINGYRSIGDEYEAPSVRYDNGKVVVCYEHAASEGVPSTDASATNDAVSRCSVYGDFQFNADHEIKDFSIDGVPIAAIILEAKSEPEQYISNRSSLTTTFMGGWIDPRSNAVWAVLRVENNQESTIKVDHAHSTCQDAQGHISNATVLGPTKLGSVRRSWLLVKGCEVGGFIGITTKIGKKYPTVWVALG